MTENGSAQKISIPIMVLIILVTWAVSAGVTYGVLATRIDWLSQRVEAVERIESQEIERPEYEAEKKDLDARLDRIERKIDALK